MTPLTPLQVLTKSFENLKGLYLDITPEGTSQDLEAPVKKLIVNSLVALLEAQIAERKRMRVWYGDNDSTVFIANAEGFNTALSEMNKRDEGLVEVIRKLI